MLTVVRLMEIKEKTLTYSVVTRKFLNIKQSWDICHIQDENIYTNIGITIMIIFRREKKRQTSYFKAKTVVLKLV